MKRANSCHLRSWDPTSLQSILLKTTLKPSFMCWNCLYMLVFLLFFPSTIELMVGALVLPPPLNLCLLLCRCPQHAQHRHPVVGHLKLELRGQHTETEEQAERTAHQLHPVFTAPPGKHTEQPAVGERGHSCTWSNVHLSSRWPAAPGCPMAASYLPAASVESSPPTATASLTPRLVTTATSPSNPPPPHRHPIHPLISCYPRPGPL